MGVVSEGYYCYSQVLARGTVGPRTAASGRSVLASRIWTRCWLIADRCRRAAGTTKATETLKHPLLQDPRGTRTR